MTTKAIGIRRGQVMDGLQKVYTVRSHTAMWGEVKWYTPTKASRNRIARLFRDIRYDLFSGKNYAVIQRK